MDENKMSVAELQQYFTSRELPNRIVLGAGETIIDTKLFVTAQLEGLKAHEQHPLGDAYYRRLIKLKTLLEK